jgi:hypothetical protein
MRNFIPVAALLLMSCQQAPSRSADLTDVLRSLQGQKVRLYLGGNSEASHAGTVTQVDPSTHLVALEYELRNREAPVTRVRKVIRIDSILAVATDESDR